MKLPLHNIIYNTVLHTAGDPIVRCVRDCLDECIDEDCRVFVARSVRLVSLYQIADAIQTHISHPYKT